MFNLSRTFSLFDVVWKVFALFVCCWGCFLCVCLGMSFVISVVNRLGCESFFSAFFSIVVSGKFFALFVVVNVVVFFVVLECVSSLFSVVNRSGCKSYFSVFRCGLDSFLFLSWNVFCYCCDRTGVFVVCGVCFCSGVFFSVILFSLVLFTLNTETFPVICCPEIIVMVCWT